ncbi:hypothetical protein [Caballeronia cordobensis]|uniref:hypothetical protein n=1 Tax=Caballeronia cordobensis TaxID=1353886 RepID=UPI00045F05C4|nr:hypothetical protein BRPE67_BCDS11150 [Burkholderia sp. RPE67]
MKVKAKTRVSYGKKQFFPGDEIEMPDRDAKLLAAAGRVALDGVSAPADACAATETSQKRAGDVRIAPKQTEKADAPEAAGDARKTPAERTAASDDEKAKSSGKKARGSYKRRDMRAADDTREDSGDTGDE